MLLCEYPGIARHCFYGGNLPIHKAIENRCQFQIIEKLIQTWPESLQQRNNNRKLPLRIACMCQSSYKSMQIIILTYPDGLSVRYIDTQLPLHDAVARYPPLHSRIIQMMVERNEEGVHETTYYGQNVLHISLKVTNVPQCMLYYLGNIICNKAYQETEENGMTPLHLACWHQNRDIVIYVLGKYNNAITLHDTNRNLPFHLACNQYEHLQSGVMHILLKCSGMLLHVKQKKTTLFHCITL